MMKKFRNQATAGFLILLAGVLLLPTPLSAAPQGKLVVALSSDVGTLDPQNHNIRINYIVGWHLYDKLVILNQKIVKIGPQPSVS